MKHFEIFRKLVIFYANGCKLHLLLCVLLLVVFDLKVNSILFDKMPGVYVS